MRRRQRIRHHYESRVTPDRDSFDILDWGSREDQFARFDILLRVIEQENLADTPCVLDVGCGMTDLAAFFDARSLPVRYIGVDITYGVLAEARRRFPGRRLLQADVFRHSPFPSRAVDVAYCSGVFNLQLGNNEAFAIDACPVLARLSRGVAVANFLHRRTPQKYDHCHYYDPDQLIDAMRKRGLNVRLIDDYLENDFTLVLRRE